MRHNNERGIALVLTLMVVALITAVVVEFAYGVYVSTNALHNWQTSQQLSLAARSATQLGARLIAEKVSRSKGYTYPGFFEYSQKIPSEEIEGTISIRIEDENARFNLNNLVYATGQPNNDAILAFGRVLKELNLKPEISDRIVDWIDPDSLPTNTQESESRAKNSSLDSIDELLAIPGIDYETFERLRPYVTIYGSGEDYAKININSAEVPVLMSLPGEMTKRLAENIVRYRELTPFEVPKDLDKVADIPSSVSFAVNHFTTKGSAFRIVATATSGDIKKVIESVMNISGSNREIVYWREY